MSIPRNLEMAMLNAIHTSPINGNERPISLCYVAVRAVLEAQRGEYRTAVMQLGPRATSEPTPQRDEVTA